MTLTPLFSDFSSVAALHHRDARLTLTAHAVPRCPGGEVKPRNIMCCNRLHDSKAGRRSPGRRFLSSTLGLFQPQWWVEFRASPDPVCDLRPGMQRAIHLPAEIAPERSQGADRNVAKQKRDRGLRHGAKPSRWHAPCHPLICFHVRAPHSLRSDARWNNHCGPFSQREA